jgi:hypothetical protein
MSRSMHDNEELKAGTMLVEDMVTAGIQAREHEETVWQSLVSNRRAMVYGMLSPSTGEIPL